MPCLSPQSRRARPPTPAAGTGQPLSFYLLLPLRSLKKVNWRRITNTLIVLYKQLNLFPIQAFVFKTIAAVTTSPRQQSRLPVVRAPSAKLSKSINKGRSSSSAALSSSQGSAASKQPLSPSKQAPQPTTPPSKLPLSSSQSSSTGKAASGPSGFFAPKRTTSSTPTKLQQRAAAAGTVTAGPNQTLQTTRKNSGPLVFDQVVPPERPARPESLVITPQDEHQDQNDLLTATYDLDALTAADNSTYSHPGHESSPTTTEPTFLAQSAHLSPEEQHERVLRGGMLRRLRDTFGDNVVEGVDEEAVIQMADLPKAADPASAQHHQQQQPAAEAWKTPAKQPSQSFTKSQISRSLSAASAEKKKRSLFGFRRSRKSDESSHKQSNASFSGRPPGCVHRQLKLTALTPSVRSLVQTFHWSLSASPSLECRSTACRERRCAPRA